MSFSRHEGEKIGVTSQANDVPVQSVTEIAGYVKTVGRPANVCLSRCVDLPGRMTIIKAMLTILHDETRVLQTLFWN
jgi:hypothetical protein